MFAQQQGGAVVSLEGVSAVSLESRIINIPISYVWYLAKVVWPSDLAVVYPFVSVWPLELVLLAAVLLVALTGAALWVGRRWPYLLAGWFWYLGTLVPVIGLIKVGPQSIADRYMYIPSIGLFVLLAWSMADLTAGWARRAVPLAVGAAIMLTASLVEQGKLDEAVAQFRTVIRLQPDHQPSWEQVGLARVKQGMAAEAAEAFSSALRIKPDDAATHCHLAAVLAGQHKTREAVEHYRAARKLLPNLPEALNNLAWILAANPDPVLRNGREAVDLAEQACKLTDYKQPLMVGTLAAAYAEAGRFAEAVTAAEKPTLTEQTHQMELAARNRALLELYRSGQPARDTF